MILRTSTFYEIISAERQFDSDGDEASNRIRFELKPHPNLVITLSENYVVCSKENEQKYLDEGKYPIPPVLHIYCADDIKQEDVDYKIGSCGLYESNQLEHKVYLKDDDYKQLLIDLNNENYPSGITFHFNEQLLLRKSGYAEFVRLNGKQSTRIPIDSFSFSVAYTQKNKIIIKEIFSVLLNTNLVIRLTLIALAVIGFIQIFSFF